MRVMEKPGKKQSSPDEIHIDFSQRTIIIFQ